MRRALVEGYSYCPYCGGGLNPPWACCGSTVASYYPRLRQARAEGWLNRTVFCFGWMLAKSQWNPGGWTHDSLRAEATKLKRSFPELGGIAFYGHTPGNASKGASRESREEDTATIELIRYASALALELYPSPVPQSVPRLTGQDQRTLGARSKTDDEIVANCSAADCTRSLQAAIDSGASTVHVPYIGRPWVVAPPNGTECAIRLRSNQTIVIGRNVEILAKRGSFHGVGDRVMMVSGVSNVSVVGLPGASIRMHRDDYADPTKYTHSEDRHGIDIADARDVVIRNLRISETGGDCIQMYPSVNVHIKDCVLDRGYRQGMSVIGATNLLVENTVMSNTNGTAPQA